MEQDNKSGNIRINKIKIMNFILIVMVIGITLTKMNSKAETALIGEINNVGHSKSKIIDTSSFPTDVYGVPVFTELIDINTEARPGIKREIKYIVIHETDNFEPGVKAKNHATFLKKNNQKSTSWHYTVDDSEIYHHIPDNEIAYHAADKVGNENGIGIELCVNRDGNYEKTFENAARLVAYLLKEYGLTVDDIRTHHDFSGKDCPHSFLKNNRMGEFKSKVNKYYDQAK